MSLSDPLYFKREDLANRLIINLKDGITHAITLFAPRRMGKTQFLLNDIQPLAKAKGFNVFYFSFMDNQTYELSSIFTQSLQDFAIGLNSKVAKAIDNLASISVLGIGIEKNQAKENKSPLISQIIDLIAKESDKPTLFLLDEVQELAREKNTQGLIKSLRTGLDKNQQKVKVIFTGSSTNGLRSMFNDNNAPFFHFAYSVDFPLLDKNFTDFMADIYQNRTGKALDKNNLFLTFRNQLGSIPLYMRSVIQDMIINPDLSLDDAVTTRVKALSELSDYSHQWNQLSELEKNIILLVHQGNSRLYTAKTKQEIANKLGIDSISTSQIQGKVKKLERADIITKGVDNVFKINSQHFSSWISNLVKDNS